MRRSKVALFLTCYLFFWKSIDAENFAIPISGSTFFVLVIILCRELFVSISDFMTFFREANLYLELFCFYF